MTYDNKDLNSLDFYPAMYGFKASYSTRFSKDFNDTSEGWEYNLHLRRTEDKYFGLPNKVLVL